MERYFRNVSARTVECLIANVQYCRISLAVHMEKYFRKYIKYWINNTNTALHHL